MTAPRPSTRWILGWAAALSVGVVAVGLTTGDVGGTPRAVVDGELALPPANAPGTAPWLSPAFELAGPTTLRVALARDDAPGRVSARVALVREDTGEVWETRLGTRVPGAAAPGPDRRRDEVLFDRLPSGRYLLRAQPDWEPADPSADGRPPRATLRADAGARSGWTAALALGLLWAPALAIAGWRVVAARRARAETTGEPEGLAAQPEADRSAAAT